MAPVSTLIDTLVEGMQKICRSIRLDWELVVVVDYIL